jgi:WD40 repeat protein
MSINIHKIAQYTGHTSSIYALVDKLHTPYFYSAGGDGYIVEWHKDGSVTDGILMAKTNAKIFCMLYIHDTKILVAGDMNGHIYWIDTVTNTIVGRIAQHEGSVFGLYRVGDYMYSVGADGYLCKWDTTLRQPILSIRLSNQGLRCLVYHDKTGVLYVGASDNSIYILRESDLSTIQCIENAHENSIFTLAMYDDKMLISGSRDAQVCVRNIADDYKIIHHFPAHWFTVNKIITAIEKDIIVTGSRDKTFRVWDANDFTLLKSVDIQKGGHINSVNDLLWFSDLQTLATTGDDRTINLWSLVKT